MTAWTSAILRGAVIGLSALFASYCGVIVIRPPTRRLR